jgi:sec-independent protein translocase protein TatA
MIPGLPQVGGTELLILLTIILLFFGAKRVPELGKSLGKSMREFRKGASEEDTDEARELRERGELPRDEQASRPVEDSRANKPKAR